MMRAPAAILLAFANDWVDDRHHLRSLLEESKAIDKSLASLVEAGAITVPSPIHNATVDDVLSAFRGRKYRGRIRIFHFGGHASDSLLLFEDKAGHPSGAHAGSLASYLGKQRGLVLVFLNGCCTEPQVRRLRQVGVPAVISTTAEIQDTVAAEFAAEFYAELATRSLREAYETAAHAVRLRSGNNPRSITRAARDVGAGDEAAAPPWPWIFDCDTAFEGWTLASELTRQSRRKWQHRALFAVAAVPLLWLMAMGVSADARRTSCRVRGVRSVCEAIDIGSVPTPGENAMWDEARSRRSGDALRTYLSRFPTGAYAEEARSRLAGCLNAPIETLGPTDEQRYPRWPVVRSPAHVFPSEDQAREDALKRGNEDASATCAAFGLKDRVLSASIEPETWDCDQHEHRFMCGFTGDLVCRVQRRVLVVEERCNEARE